MTRMGIQIGVDGGGSKTEIVALDQTSRVLQGVRIIDGGSPAETKGREVGLVGGIVNMWEFLEPSFQSTLQEEFTGIQLLKPMYPPSVGAALLSRISQVRRIIF